MLNLMQDSSAFAGASLASVRYAVVGGEAMPEPLIRTWQDKGVPIRQGFGMTEVGPNCFSLPERDALRKIGSIGLPNLYVETRVVDDAGHDVAPGHPGELLLGGPVVTPGYWNRPDATRDAFDGPWFRTGDLVRVDEEGYFYVVGRKKDMFISGGENVYPAEVERAIVSHPDVAACSVVGVPDERWGEAGAAYVVLCPGASLSADDVRAYARERLAGFKVPRHVRFLDALPTGHSGKVLKTELRARIRSEASASLDA
jgi:fatty-acyl-CoA synthase